VLGSRGGVLWSQRVARDGAQPGGAALPREARAIVLSLAEELYGLARVIAERAKTARRREVLDFEAAEQAKTETRRQRLLRASARHRHAADYQDRMSEHLLALKDWHASGPYGAPPRPPLLDLRWMSEDQPLG
jgi:hypothetical protein